ncbi:Uncharacterized protein FVE85_1779 [Porphyridium purpureum]|uniref:FIST domain-containing protein n=1 Tax=Porphyridium purpureum TaxID=35688 RepID=A0A5J4YY40_PORPP|nr:Uncharacterized protein FVE85_1779 [Porphyridium purpureum]|eukprot:POR9038..scf209_3
MAFQAALGTRLVRGRRAPQELAALCAPARAPALRCATHRACRSHTRGKGHTRVNVRMALKSGAGQSVKEDTNDAVREAVAQASASVANPAIAFVSCTVARPADEVRAAFAAALPPNTPIHGLTSSGALLSSFGSAPNAVGCLLLDASDAPGAFAAISDMGGDAGAAAKKLKQAMPQPAVIVMSATPGAEEACIAALTDVFGPNVPIFGGTAADNALTGEWQVFSAEGASGTGVSFVGIGSQVAFGASMLGPYEATSRVGVATKTEGRRVFDINGKPASEWVYEWLGDAVKDAYENGGLILPVTSTRPVGIKQSSGEYVTMHLAALGGRASYADFFAPVPQGAELVIMDSGEGPSTGYAKTLSDAYDAARSQLGASKNPSAALLVYCGGMAIAVGDKLDTGLTSPAFKDRVAGLPLLGMTCFGEQARLPLAQSNVQRNLSVGLLLLA